MTTYLKAVIFTRYDAWTRFFGTRKQEPGGAEDFAHASAGPRTRIVMW